MLVLTRLQDELIRIDVSSTFQIGIEASEEVSVNRKETPRKDMFIRFE